MGLTQISTNGVKTNTLTSDDIASSAITVAELAVDAVEDDRIKTSNSPSAGKFLKYKDASDKLTWADAASEGTEIKSTGESGTTKFLRVDGDGSCSWQVPPDTNTQLTLHDEDNFASNSATAAASQQSIKAYVDTQVGSISAAPEVTGTASGSIAANAAVIVKSNGEFKTITGVSESLEADEDGPNANQVSGYSDQHHDLSTAYDATNGKIMAVWYEDRAGDEYTYAAVGTVSGSDVTWGSKVDLFSSNDYTLRTRTRVCCVGSNKFVLVYAMPNPTNRAKAVVLTVSGSSISVGTESHFPAHNYAVTDMDICATTSGGRFWVVYVSSQYAGCRFNTGTVSGSSISWGGEMVPRDHNTSWPRAKYIAENDTMILHWRNTTNYDNEAVAYTNASSTHPSSIGSYMTVDNESSEAGKFPNVDWDSVNNRLVFTYARAANAGGDTWNLHAKIATISGTTISVGSDRILIGSGIRINKQMELTVDDTGRFVGVYRGYDNEKPYYFAFKLNSALDGITEVTAPALIHANSISTSGSSDRVEIDVEHIGNSKFVITYSQGGGNPKSIKSRTKVYPSTDMTTGNFVGFSSAAYTNGQTATVKVVGNTTTQSGLTTGKKYYITKTGTLSTTADDPIVEAGIALSSTKLLIRQ